MKHLNSVNANNNKGSLELKIRERPSGKRVTVTRRRKLTSTGINALLNSAKCDILNQWGKRRFPVFSPIWQQTGESLPRHRIKLLIPVLCF